MLDFKPFAQAVAAQFALMSQHELYTTKVSGDTVYDFYLAAFPKGTDPIYRVATEHTCSTCRNFIKNIGNLVAIIDGKVVTVWDTVTTGDAYEIVATTLANLVGRAEIDTIFRTSEPKYGAHSNTELREDGVVALWHHFHGVIAAKHFVAKNAAKSPEAVIGEFNAAKDVFTRGLKELTSEALSTVSTLIADKQLYRGEEHLPALLAFTKMHQKYRDTNDANKNVFIMANAFAPASRFRNTVIGSLVTELSDGVSEEQAIKAFEKKVAPENYKRPTALVTEAMKKAAMLTIIDLGLEDSLVRRLARTSDITINNVMWADGNVKAAMKEGIEGMMDLIGTKSHSEASGLVQEISITDFLATVLPKAKNIEMQVKNRHLSNFMALTAPALPSNGDLFKWDNNFAWTYVGNISDSIKERVKAAGGATDAVLRVSLAWHNGDDLDLHAYEPAGEHIYFGTRGRKTGKHRGMLDVDMNAGRAVNTKDPVENITWDLPGNGEFRIDVNNFSLRDKSNTGYTLQVENAGVVHEYTSEQSPSNGATHNGALIIKIQDGKVASIKPLKHLTGGSYSQQKWGIDTEQMVRVNMVMLSPNHWDGNAVGNKHYMFILEGCKTDEPLRGILNEYLSPKLEAHRKVFEVLGDKTKCQPTEEQLAGLGFSSTKGDSVQVSVATDKSRKSYNIIF